MTRGLQKEQARERAQERADKHKGGTSNLKARVTDMVCPICRTSIANSNQLTEHYGSKHPKAVVPPYAGAS